MPHIRYNKVASDGVTLDYHLWSPVAPPRAVVCLVHGLGEHAGRYDHVGRLLNESGYALMGFDQRGHGHTAGPRGVTPPFERTLDDITLLLDEAATRFAGKPRFLYGHSMGGNWVLNYALRCRPAVAGVIATSPGLRTAFKPPAIKVMLGKVLYRLAPDMVMPNGLNQDAISRDPEVVKAYAADPLVHDKMSARLGLDILQQGEWALAHAAEFPPIPLLLVHGAADSITSVPATREFADKATGDVTFKEWPECYHETHNEPEKAAVLAYMISWLDQHLLSS